MENKPQPQHRSQKTKIMENNQNVELSKSIELSEEDLRFLSEKTPQVITDFIGLRKYEYLYDKRQKFNNYSIQHPNTINPYKLSDLETEQINSFEENKFSKKEPSKKEIEYWDKLIFGTKESDFKKDGVYPTKKVLYIAFKIAYKNIFGDDFIETKETIENLAVVINYLAKEDAFFESPLIVKSLDDKPLVNSFYKGLLIIGNYGCGKSSIMETMSFVVNHYYNESYKDKWISFKQWNDIRFKFQYCHRIVTEFEGLDEPEDRVLFFNKYSGKVKFCFDDLTKEAHASNYGKKNLMQDLFEKRYDNRAITHITMNPPAHAPNSPQEAINLIGEKYGGHNYDRVKSMFNVIHFKGNSFRK